MTFNPLDLANWKRAEVFNHFLQQNTTFSITTEIEIGHLHRNLKRKGYKFYPAFLFIVASVINSNPVFRTGYNSEGDLGYWDHLDPLYTIFDSESELFSAIWTSAGNDFKRFNECCLTDLTQYQASGKLFPKKPVPETVFSVSMIPWTSFSGFNLNIHNNGNYLLPIVTAGKFTNLNHSLRLPVSLQVHHAVCDGYHAGMFMNAVQDMANRSDDWMN